MDKRIILAVAGSGKTRYLIDELNLERKCLFITYTINNTRNLKEGIIKKFGYFPENINLYTYYNFLYSFCFRPFLAYKIKPKGIQWEAPPKWTSMKKRSDPLFYLTNERRLYSNRIAKLLETCSVFEEINDRIVKYYDCLFIDEIQDFAGHDFNLLKSIAKANLEMKLVGDFYQHTFDTSRDGNTNANLHKNYIKYQKEFEKMGVEVDTERLNKSYRCSPTICKFITDEIGIVIQSHYEEETIVQFIDKEEAGAIYNNNNIVKLFYRENYKYDCFSRNWGDCKGENCYDDVCVVLNKTTMKHYKEGKLNELKPVTKNKLYVACSRANKGLYLVSEELIKNMRRTHIKSLHLQLRRKQKPERR